MTFQISSSPASIAASLRQQLVAAAERQRQRGEVGHDALGAAAGRAAFTTRLIAHDEPAADGVIHAARELGAVRRERGEAHAVRMQRQ
jgi:hypothetical protein